MTDLDDTLSRLMTERDGPSSTTDISGRITSEQIRRFTMVWAPAIDVWKDEEAAVAFLKRRHAMLKDRRPIDVALLSDDGAQSVRDILKRLQYGTAA